MSTPDLLAQCQSNRAVLLAENAALTAEVAKLRAACESVLEAMYSTSGFYSQGCRLEQKQETALTNLRAACESAR